MSFNDVVQLVEFVFPFVFPQWIDVDCFCGMFLLFVCLDALLKEEHLTMTITLMRKKIGLCLYIYVYTFNLHWILYFCVSLFV